MLLWRLSKPPIHRAGQETQAGRKHRASWRPREEWQSRSKGSLLAEYTSIWFSDLNKLVVSLKAYYFLIDTKTIASFYSLS